MGVNSLPKTVTRQRRDCDLNPGSSEPESSTLTTRLPSHPYANALYILSSCVCQSACFDPSVTRRYCIETTGRIELFWHGTCPTLCYKEIRIRRKIRALSSSGTLSRTLDLENFATATWASRWRTVTERNDLAIALIGAHLLPVALLLSK